MSPSTDTAPADVTAADVQRWSDAWNSHDMARILDLFTDDVTMHQPQNPEPLDKAGIERFFTMLLGSYEDIHFAPEGHTIQGRDVASWEHVTGTMTGPFEDPGSGETVEPTHRSFDLLAAMHLVYGDEAKIRNVRLYWDRLTLMTQLGLMKS